ncbi:hypothetical protein [Sphingobacterium sp. BIGb0116]|uniref:hypothetical protein n=1 Tax=Sphingobacterium sp. BIGb0116 TaxID=2940619 RepID=UPI00216A888C|nr:hypothetical protein [Sphingobacterium sp. BIGb0116]MCS4164450.1 hypothetical protein [Sphingobacterium sp. BIGb0116]
MERTIKALYEMRNYELNEEHLDHAHFVCLREIVKCYKKEFSSNANYDLDSFLPYVKLNTVFTVFDTTTAKCSLTDVMDIEKWLLLKEQGLSQVCASCTLKDGSWNKPVVFEAEPLLSLNDLHLIFKGNK